MRSRNHSDAEVAETAAIRKAHVKQEGYTLLASVDNISGGALDRR